MNKYLILLSSLCFNFVFSSKLETSADLVVFSYNRPLQLYSFLESIDFYIKGIKTKHVIYRSDEGYDDAYAIVQNNFSDCIFTKQGKKPQKDFKPLAEKAAFESPSAYVLFAVDDIIVKDFIDVEQCILLLNKTQAYGFYFRLGKNLTECYMLQKKQPLPPLSTVASGIYSWTLKEGVYDWGYPNTLDMTLYKKSDIKKTLESLSYNSPNTLESMWNRLSYQVISKKGLCFEKSAIINIPMNLVQKDFGTNRHTGSFTTVELLDLFKKGYKIDIKQFHQILNRGAHSDYIPTFIFRDSSIQGVQ